MEGDVFVFEELCITNEIDFAAGGTGVLGRDYMLDHTLHWTYRTYGCGQMLWIKQEHEELDAQTKPISTEAFTFTNTIVFDE